MRHNHSNSTQGLGKGMIAIAWIIGLGSLTFFFQGKVNEQFNPNKTPTTARTESGARQIVLKRSRNNQYVLGGFINDLPVTFLVDTGATQMSIPENVAKKAGLRKGRSGKASTAGGYQTIYATTIDSMLIGDIEILNVRGHINPGMTDDTILLGMNVLNKMRIEQSGNTMILSEY